MRSTKLVDELEQRWAVDGLVSTNEIHETPRTLWMVTDEVRTIDWEVDGLSLGLRVEGGSTGAEGRDR